MYCMAACLSTEVSSENGSDILSQQLLKKTLVLQVVDGGKYFTLYIHDHF